MVSLKADDALLIADVQNDFLPGGALGISGGDAIIPILLNYIHRFQSKGLPIFFDARLASAQPLLLQEAGRPLAGSLRRRIARLPAAPSFRSLSAVIIYKAIDANEEAYSAFQHTSLQRHLQALAVRRLFIGGLATDYCVLNTIKDARALGYDVCLLTDGIKAVNVRLDDGRKAELEMIQLGAVPMRVEALAT